MQLSENHAPGETSVSALFEALDKKKPVIVLDPSKPLDLAMLNDLMADIELSKRNDPKASLGLLKQLKQADVDLQTLQSAKTEKFLRELSSMPLTIYQTSKGDFEAMKKLAKDILKGWADQRRRQILFTEEKV